MVEHTEKKKRIRTIEPVMICDKELYEKDPIKYCTESLQLADPVIIVKKVRFDMLWELDGSKVYITGRTGKQLVCKHSYELVADSEHEQYIKRIGKYTERCNKAKKELEITAFDDIDYERNVGLYDWFILKLNAEVYVKLLKNVLSALTENRDKFCNMTLNAQCKLLLEILKVFKCDRQLGIFDRKR